MACIALANVAHSYLKNRGGESDYALKRIDTVWDDGGAYALLGPSGCGKTTLLNIISGLLKPSEGKILYDGRDVTEMTPEKRNIAQVFQFPVLYDTMSVYENLAFPLKNRKMKRIDIDRRVREVADILVYGLYRRYGKTRSSRDERRRNPQMANGPVPSWPILGRGDETGVSGYRLLDPL